MKMKGDFVTNSSSTSFVIHAKISGIIPCIMLDRNELNSMGWAEKMQKTSKDLLPGFALTSPSYSQYITMIQEGKPEFMDGKTEIVLHPTEYFDPEFEITQEQYHDPDFDYENAPDNPTPITIVSLNMLGAPGVEADRRTVLIEAKQILERLLINAPDSTYTFNYLQEPIDMHSGGWDGGDPMGYYEYSFECIRKETKIGTINIKKKNGEFLSWEVLKNI